MQLNRRFIGYDDNIRMTPKGSRRSCSAAVGHMTSLAVLHDARGPELPVARTGAACRILQSCPSRCKAAKTNGLYLHTLSGISSYLLYFGAIAKIRAIDGMP